MQDQQAMQYKWFHQNVSECIPLVINIVNSVYGNILLMLVLWNEL